MKVLLNDKKELLSLKRKSCLFEAIVLIIMCIIVYEYDISLSDITLLYLFPIMVSLMSCEYIIILDNYKKIDIIYYIVSLILSLSLLIIPVYIVITKNIDSYIFIRLLGGVLIIRNIISYLVFGNRKLCFVKNIFMVVIGALLIIFNVYISNHLVSYLIILFSLLSLLKIIYFIRSKKALVC